MPKPYYSHAGQTIYFGDAREILPHWRGSKLLCHDPPYGMNNCRLHAVQRRQYATRRRI